MIRRKGFTLVEMLVVIMIIAILAAALFPAISAAIAQAKATAMKNKGRGIWTAVLSANAEREPLGMQQVWPAFFSSKTSTDYFKSLLGWTGAAGSMTWPSGGVSPICEDLKPTVLSGSGMVTSTDPGAFSDANNAWCMLALTNAPAEDAFIFSRNIDFDSGIASGSPVKNSNISMLLPTSDSKSGSFSLNRGIYVTYGGACIDRREKYMPLDATGTVQTNNLVGSTNVYIVGRPT